MYNKTAKILSSNGDVNVSEEKPTNKMIIEWQINRLRRYLLPEDEKNNDLLNSLIELSNDPNIENIKQNIIDEYENKVTKDINISNILDKFPINKIESYLRKKKIDVLNESEMSDTMDIGSIQGSGI